MNQEQRKKQMVERLQRERAGNETSRNVQAPLMSSYDNEYDGLNQNQQKERIMDETRNESIEERLLMEMERAGNETGRNVQAPLMSSYDNEYDGMIMNLKQLNERCERCSHLESGTKSELLIRSKT